MARTCGNCGNKQGPFDRVFIGSRRTGQNVFTCRVPRASTEKQRLDAIRACGARKEASYATT